MSLDLSKVASQVDGMVSKLKEARADRAKRLKYALELVSGGKVDVEKLRDKISKSKTTWLVAGLVDGIAGKVTPPLTPPDFNVLATDGSHIDVDRHHGMRCYLINIGSVALTYGAKPDALLASSPSLYADDKDMVITSPDNSREQMVEGNLLGAKRSVEECRQLAKLAAGMPKGSNNLALLDGTLLMWGLEAFPDWVKEAVLDNGLIPCLDEMRKLTGDRSLALASYISFPRSTDVVNALKIHLCPMPAANCDKCPAAKREERACEAVGGVQDRELFDGLLGEGERSALFISRSKVVEEHYEAKKHDIYFFYIKSSDEVARVELPQWAARDESLLNLTHALILDQCRRGQGYPVALAEAHEQAVVTGPDRNNFWQLVEEMSVGGKLQTLNSAKSMSKRMRGV